MMKRTVRNPPAGRLEHRSPVRPDIGDCDEEVDSDRDDGISDTNYSDDFEDDDEAEKQNKDTAPVVCAFRTITLHDGFRLLVPEDDQHLPDHPCKIKCLSAEKRSELLSEFQHISDDIVISDAYEVTDLTECITTHSSRSKLRFPSVLPTTRLDHADLFRFHVMAKERNGDWKKVPAEYRNSELTFPLKGVNFFIAYAQPIPEIIDVTSSGFTFKSAKSKEISVEIPKGAVHANSKMKFKVYPVNMDRMNAYKNIDAETITDIYAITDILYVRHTMNTVLQREGSVRLPLDRVAREHDIKYLIKNSSGNYEIIDIDKNQAVKDGQVEVSYKGDPKMRCQVVCARPGAQDDDLIRGAAYLTGQIDSCTILFFLSKSRKERFLTVEFVDKTVEERVLRNRSERGFYEIKNSRLDWVELGKKRRIRVDLGGNLQSADRTKDTRFTFVYNLGCKNNALQFRMAKNQYGQTYCIVEVFFDGRQVHNIHFNYPDAGQKVDAIKNTFLNTDKRKAHCKSIASMLDSGYNTERTGTEDSHKTNSNSKSSESARKLTPKRDPKSESDSESPPGYNTERTGTEDSHKTNLNSTSPQSARKLTPKKDWKPKSDSELVPDSPDQRPITAFTEASTIPEKGHPLLKDASLSILGKNLSPKELSELMLRADFKLLEINNIRRKADEDYISDNTLLLSEWKRKKKNEFLLSDSEILDSLKNDLHEIGRNDIVAILKRLTEKEKPRSFKRKDFEHL